MCVNLKVITVRIIRTLTNNRSLKDLEFLITTTIPKITD